jgi:hypothetical protein
MKRLNGRDSIHSGWEGFLTRFPTLVWLAAPGKISQAACIGLFRDPSPAVQSIHLARSGHGVSIVGRASTAAGKVRVTC